MRLLLVEDDESLGDAVQTGLRHFGYLVEWLKNGETARLALKTNTFELIILDLGLPTLSGMELLQALRRDGCNTPVIILTARDAINDRINGLDSGADDYMTKPFDLNELVARIRALKRRSFGRTETIIHYQNLTLDPSSHSVKINGLPVKVHRREFALLQTLLENCGHVLSREQLMQSIYGWNDDVDSNVLEVHVHNLRKKFHTQLIRTIRGVGYMIEKQGSKLT